MVVTEQSKKAKWFLVLRATSLPAWPQRLYFSCCSTEGERDVVKGQDSIAYGSIDVGGKD
jgi:hypothetical protein